MSFSASSPGLRFACPDFRRPLGGPGSVRLFRLVVSHPFHDETVEWMGHPGDRPGVKTQFIDNQTCVTMPAREQCKIDHTTFSGDGSMGSYKAPVSREKVQKCERKESQPFPIDSIGTTRMIRSAQFAT